MQNDKNPGKKHEETQDEEKATIQLEKRSEMKKRWKELGGRDPSIQTKDERQSPWAVPERLQFFFLFLDVVNPRGTVLESPDCFAISAFKLLQVLLCCNTILTSSSALPSLFVVVELSVVVINFYSPPSFFSSSFILMKQILSLILRPLLPHR